jgi:hypothetical protein
MTSLEVTGNNLFAGTDGGGVFRSTDNGSSSAQTGLTNVQVKSLAVSGNMLFAGSGFCTIKGGCGGEVYRSANNGIDWLSLYQTGVVTGLGLGRNALGQTNLFVAWYGCGITALRIVVRHGL